MRAISIISSLFLVTVLVMQLTVPFFTIQSKRNAFYAAAKKKMKTECAEKILLKNILSDNSFHWEKEGKEFFYKGEIYDLVSFKKIDGEYFVFAVNDVQEKAYLNNLAKNDPTSDDGLFSFAPFHLIPPRPIQQINFCTHNLLLTFYYSFSCKSHYQFTGYTPPDFLV